jgi:putative oxidoreductase
MIERLISTKAPASVALIRLAAGAIFVSEGIQKFLFPDALGIGRFIKIGIPMPEFMAPFVAVVEIGCGLLLLIGLLTRLAAIPLTITMLVAIATTKLPVFLKSGFWTVAHDGRADFAMLLSCLFLLVAGAGTWSLDAKWNRKVRV